MGVGLRPPHYSHVLDTLPPVPWFEVISENFFGLNGEGGRPRQLLEQVRAHYPIVLHGTALSIGSTDPLDRDYLKNLKNLIHVIEPAWVTDHLCWTSVGGEHLHDLLPLPYNTATLNHVVNRVHAVQEFLGQPIGLENASSYVTFRSSDRGEAAFLTEVARRTGAGILLDVNNIYVSCTNHGWDVNQYLAELDFSRVWQFHLAGHQNGEFGLVDTHDAPVPDAVWEIYRQCLLKTGPLASLVEWDANIPPFERLCQEAQRAREMEEVVFGTQHSTEKISGHVGGGGDAGPGSPRPLGG